MIAHTELLEMIAHTELPELRCIEDENNEYFDAESDTLVMPKVISTCRHGFPRRCWSR